MKLRQNTNPGKYQRALNVRDEEGRTPLFFAASNGSVRVVKLLLRKGSDPNIPNVNGATPLQLSAAHGETAVVRLLLSYGADPNIGTGAYPDGTGETGPLYWARRNRHYQIVEILIDAGAK